MPNTYVPSTDGGLVSWSQNMAQQLAASFALYGVPEATAAQFVAVQAAYEVAYEAAAVPATRSKSLVFAKNEARKMLKARIAAVAKIVEANESVTGEQKVQLGLRLRKPPARIGRPGSAPRMSIVSVDGRTVTVRVRGEASGTAANPAGTASACLYTFVGNQAPADIDAWDVYGLATRTTTNVSFGASVPPGSLVHLTARWLNPRGEAGPVAAPVCVNIAGGVARRAA